MALPTQRVKSNQATYQHAHIITDPAGTTEQPVEGNPPSAVMVLNVAPGGGVILTLGGGATVTLTSATVGVLIPLEVRSVRNIDRDDVVLLLW